jgi:hypothetical protein
MLEHVPLDRIIDALSGSRTRPADRISPDNGLHLEVLSSTPHRGENVRARLGVAESGAEVGLVCVTTHEDRQAPRPEGTGRGGASGSSVTGRVAHESWVHLMPGAVLQVVDLEVPAEGPFSQQDEVVSHSWRVMARRRRPRDPESVVELPIWVLP